MVVSRVSCKKKNLPYGTNPPLFTNFFQEFDQKTAAKKADEMAKKTQEFRTLFSTPEGERVIQDYAASVRGAIMGGRLYISANYVCYASNFTSYTVCCPFSV